MRGLGGPAATAGPFRRPPRPPGRRRGPPL